MTSTQAQAAKIIRKHLKEKGIPATVRSESASMMTAVDVTIQQDLTPEEFKEIKEYVDQFQFGSFDGMNDIYEYTNVREDLPQVKYANVRVVYSAEIKQASKDYIANINGIPEFEKDRYAWMALNGSWGDFWATV